MKSKHPKDKVSLAAKKIRLMLKDGRVMSSIEIMQATSLTQPAVSKAIQQLKERREVELAGKAAGSDGRKTVYMYRQTARYAEKLKNDRERFYAKTETERLEPAVGANHTKHYAPPAAIKTERKPWYKRVVAWIAGGSESRA